MTQTTTLLRFTQLFMQPRVFFARTDFGTRPIELAFVLYVVGIAAVIDRISSKMTRSELASPSAAMTQSLTWIAESWAHYWLVLAIIGILSMAMFWYIGGWWYALRLRWAGASNVTSMTARRLYVYQEFVAAFPTVLTAFAQTVIFSSYGQAWQADEYWSLTPLAFVLLSCWTGYAGATTSFALRPLPALFWFALLPLLIYAISLGILASMVFLHDAPPVDSPSVDQAQPEDQPSRFEIPEILPPSDIAIPREYARRNAPPLEQFDLSEYRLSRIDSRGNHATTAQVIDPSGRSHRIHVGTSIGRNFGRVKAIDIDHVTVIELYRGNMEWEEHVSTLQVEK